MTDFRADFPGGPKAGPPQVDALGFDHRLLNPGRLLQLAGKVPLRFSEPGIPLLWLDCEACGKGIEPLTDERGAAYPVTAGQLLANVLRHQVMRHDVPLSGAGAGDGS
jgi:hypothetical protein